jgi:hypothetical protein
VPRIVNAGGATDFNRDFAARAAAALLRRDDHVRIEEFPHGRGRKAQGEQRREVPASKVIELTRFLPPSLLHSISPYP